MLLSALLIACAPQRDCEARIWYVDDGAAGDVQVVADWNGWSPEPLDPHAEGAWTLALDLPAGDHAYALVVDGEQTVDVYAPLRAERDGAEVSLLRVESCEAPALQIAAASATPGGSVEIALDFLPGGGGSPLAGVEAVWFDEGAAAPWRPPLQIASSRGEISLQASGLPSGKHTALVTAWDADGQVATARAPLWVEADPFDWRDALIYQVVLDRFAGADGALAPDGYDPDMIGSRFGGDLAGVLAELESGYFEALGVRALWLSPLYQNPTGHWPGNDGHEYAGYHGYWPIDPAAIEPALGDEAAVHDLVAAAHARGIRVVLDVVPNHVHEQHPYAQNDGWLHPDPDCICGEYTCPWSEDIETCWFTDYLPDLDWEHPEVAAAMVADTVAWGTRFDLDGFRVDAVPMMTRAANRELHYGISRAMEQGPTDFYTLGETFTGAGDYGTIRENLGPFALDGQFDFPLMWAIRDLVAWGSGDAAALADAVAASDVAWAGSGSVMANFVGNHDMSRFISEADDDDLSDPWGAPPPEPTDPLAHQKLLMAQAIAWGLPGAAVLYYGDEIGLPGANDPDCRRPMRFGPGLSDLQIWTLHRTQNLGRARSCSRALRRGDLTVLRAEGSIFAWLRSVGDGLPALGVVNAGDTDARVTLDFPDDLLVSQLGFTDAIEGSARLTLSRDATIELPAWTTRIYLPDTLDCLP